MSSGFAFQAMVDTRMGLCVVVLNCGMASRMKWSVISEVPKKRTIPVSVMLHDYDRSRRGLCIVGVGF